MKLWIQNSLVACLLPILWGSTASALDPVSGYEDRQLEGWTVRISTALLDDHRQQTHDALGLLQTQLQKVAEVLPEEAVREVRRVPIWLSPPYDGFGQKAEYHPDLDWLLREGRHPDLAKCVELTNTAILEKEVRRMPMLMLHELAHAYHHRVLGFEQSEIVAAYANAVESGIYERVQRGNGRVERAYALTNHKEYFAELSECYFGMNDFYPFDRQQLERHDEAMFTLLGKLWNIDTVTPRPNAENPDAENPNAENPDAGSLKE